MFQYYWVNTGHFLKIPVLLGKSSITGALATLNHSIPQTLFFIKKRLYRTWSLPHFSDTVPGRYFIRDQHSMCGGG